MAVPDHLADAVILGYAVIQTDGNFGYPSFCVHGPNRADTPLQDPAVRYLR